MLYVPRSGQATARSAPAYAPTAMRMPSEGAWLQEEGDPKTVYLDDDSPITSLPNEIEAGNANCYIHWGATHQVQAQKSVDLNASRPPSGGG